MSNAYGKPGQDMIHEITEAYEGAKISQRSGVGVGSSTLDDERNPYSVYRRAHDSAVPQSGRVYETLYDITGKIVEDPGIAIRSEYKVKPRRQKPMIFHVYP